MMKSRRRATGLAAALVIAGCTQGAPPEEAGGARFVEVGDGDTWTDVASRLVTCEGQSDVTAIADYLQEANPVIDEVGLSVGQIVAFDPGAVDLDSCELDAPSGDDELVAAGSAADSSDGSDNETVSEADGGEVAEAAVVAVEPASMSVLFEEDFADPDAMNRFRWQIHHKPSANGTPDEWQADHDEDCSAPPSLRTVSRPEEGNDPGDVAYICGPGGPETAHLMTTFRTTGYAQVAFSPNEIFDGVGTVCWDQNFTDLGSRRWTQLIVVPEETFHENDERLDYVKPGLEDGPGKSGVFLTDGVFMLVVQTGSTVTHVGQDIGEQNFRGYTNEDKKRRFRVCVEDLEDGTVRLELERETETEVRVMQGSLPDGPARVIFQDDTYNSTKSSSPVEAPFTWHWDNLLVAS